MPSNIAVKAARPAGYQLQACRRNKCFLRIAPNVLVYYYHFGNTAQCANTVYCALLVFP